MSASIRGHQGQFRSYQDGKELQIFPIKTVDVNMDSTFIRSMYVGAPIPEGDQAIEGFSGSIEMEVKGPEVEDFIDALITNNLNGIGVSDYSFVTTEFYADGRSRSYVYFDVQWKMSRHQAGLQEKITKKLEFQAQGRQAL